MKLRVSLNGTDENPYHPMGLTMNPFPQIAVAEYDAAVRQVAKLGGDPIPDSEYIRETLRGFAPEFVDLCVSQYRPGEYVEFEVLWKDPHDLH